MLEDRVMGKDMENFYKWKKKNLLRYELNINKETEKDIYKHFSKQKNKRAYLIGLIRKDIEKDGK